MNNNTYIPKKEKGHIIVVDDEKRNVIHFSKILKRIGYTISEAYNGAEAIEVAKKNTNADLVLLDINMPVLDGYEACKGIKAMPEFKEVPVLFLTANSDTDSIVKGFEAGGVDYITKPFNNEELLIRINTHIQLKKQKDLLRKYSGELETLNATKDKFFSIIAHDLKNPFASLIMVAKMLQKSHAKMDDAQRNDLINEILNTSQHGFKLLENLLEWSRSQTGAITIDKKSFNVQTQIEDIISLLKTQAGNKRITINHNTHTDITAQTDISLFSTILRNLVSNAIKYTPENGSIEINTEKNGSFLKFRVIDSGVGIPQNIKDKLFKIEEDISSQLGTHEETGTGLGLILCREFTQKLKGNIGVESIEGKGSTFWFEIPY